MDVPKVQVEGHRVEMEERLVAGWALEMASLASALNPRLEGPIWASALRWSPCCHSPEQGRTTILLGLILRCSRDDVIIQLTITHD